MNISSFGNNWLFLSCVLISVLTAVCFSQITELLTDVERLKQALNGLSQLAYAGNAPNKRQTQQVDTLQSQIKTLQQQLAVSRRIIHIDIMSGRTVVEHVIITLFFHILMSFVILQCHTKVAKLVDLELIFLKLTVLDIQCFHPSATIWLYSIWSFCHVSTMTKVSKE